jgi:hypothetical protein
MVKHCLRLLGSLFALQLLFSAIVFLVSSWQLPALVLGLGFLYLITRVARQFGAQVRKTEGHRARAWAFFTGLIWQLPGLQGSVRFVTDQIGWTSYDGMTDLQDFGMETWHTVLLPLAAQIPSGWTVGIYAPYYLALLLASPLLVVLLTTAAGAPARLYATGRIQRVSRL